MLQAFSGLSDIFQEFFRMKSSFPGFFANGTEEIAKLWQECLFVLDANVLLSLYRFSDSTSTELLKIFESLANRLWIPHHVANEYLANRLGVLGDQLKAYDEASKKVEALQKSLENINQAPFVSESTQKDAAKVFERLAAEFAEKRGVHDRRVYSDDIKDTLESLFSGRVGKPFTREQMEQHISDGETRYAESVPPGYEDRKKGGDSKLFSDRCKPYGDYFVWLQMIEKAKEDEVPILFITGDVKDDWWLSFQGKTIGPLPALVEEFQRKTGKGFYMYTPHRFLERAKEHLKQEVSQVAVDEIKNSERPDDIRVGRGARSAIKRAIHRTLDIGPVEQIMRERQELVRRGALLKAEYDACNAKRSELLAHRDMLLLSDEVPGNIFTDDLTFLDAQCSHLVSELEYTRHKINACNYHLSEFDSDISADDL